MLYKCNNKCALVNHNQNHKIEITSSKQNLSMESKLKLKCFVFVFIYLFFIRDFNSEVIMPLFCIYINIYILILFYVFKFSTNDFLRILGINQNKHSFKNLGLTYS